MKFEVRNNGTLVTTATGTTVNLTGLTPATKYTVGVTPTNGLDKGVEATVIFTTLSAAPNPNLFSLLYWLAHKTASSSNHVVNITLKPSTTYTVSTSYPDPTSSYYDMWADKSGVSMSSSSDPLSKSHPRTITTGSDGVIVVQIRDTPAGPEIESGQYWIKIEEGTVATAWVAAEADRTVMVPSDDTITVSYYEYAIGTEPDGLGTGPYGLGGSEPKTIVPTSSKVADGKTTLVLPIEYTPTGQVTQHHDGNWYLTTGYKTLLFELAHATPLPDDNTGTTQPSQPAEITWSTSDGTTGLKDGATVKTSVGHTMTVTPTAPHKVTSIVSAPSSTWMSTAISGTGFSFTPKAARTYSITVQLDTGDQVTFSLSGA